MKIMNKCIIEDCKNEAVFFAKVGGKYYYSCKKHELDVAQIVAAEHSREEMERAEKKYLLNISKEDVKKNPKWMKI